MRVGVLTISDRAAAGDREDASGPVIRSLVEGHGWVVQRADILPDEPDLISNTLQEWADSGVVDVILTTGGTGFAPRDRTPEATKLILDRFAPGIAEAMRRASIQVTPHAMLSRGVAGIRGQTLIINLPGSPKAVRENLEVVLPVLPHAVDLLLDSPGSESGHRIDSQPL